MDIKIEEWTRLSTRFVDDKVIKCVMLQRNYSVGDTERADTYMGYDEVLLAQKDKVR